MHIPITFKDFSNEKSFLALQNKFSIQDERANPFESDVHDKVIPGDFKIIVKEVNPISYEEEYLDKSFYNDFLYPAIDSLSKSYLEHLKRQLENPVFLDKGKITLFATKEQQKLEHFNESINQSKYLSKPILEKLEIQIDIVIEHLSKTFIQPNIELEEKLKFKLERDVLLLLFAMLRNKKIIDAPYNADFGNFIDNNFIYWNSQEKSYKHISRSNKVISDLNSGNKSFKKGLKKIKEIFTDESFYNFPY